MPEIPAPSNTDHDDDPVNINWRVEPRFNCRTCHQPARIHPYTDRIWGCLTCGFTTASDSGYFQPQSEADQHS